MTPIPYIEIQEHPAAKSISDDDLCASCRNCLYCPGDLSLCKLTLDGGDFPALCDEDGYSYECEMYDMLDRDEIHGGVNFVDPASLIRNEPITALGFYAQLHNNAMQKMAQFPGISATGLLRLGRLFTYQLFNGEQFSVPLIDTEEWATLAPADSGAEPVTVRVKTLSLLCVAMVLSETTPPDQQTTHHRRSEMDNSPYKPAVLLPQLRSLLLSAAEFKEDAVQISSIFGDLFPDVELVDLQDTQE